MRRAKNAQRTDRDSASLPAIFNLFLLWGVFFITWAILMVEVFSLTRWMTMGTYVRAQLNCAAIPYALARGGES